MSFRDLEEGAPSAVTAGGAPAGRLAESARREEAAVEELGAELVRTPVGAWPGLAVSDRFAHPAFLERLCAASWSLDADRAEHLAGFGCQVARGLAARGVEPATSCGLIARTQATLGDAWRRQGRSGEADLAFLRAFGMLGERTSGIDLGLVAALASRCLRDQGELREAGFAARLATRLLRREGLPLLAAGAWGEVAALAAESGACGRVDAALRCARRLLGSNAQEAAARPVARGVLRLLLLGKSAAAVALARAARWRLRPGLEARAALAEIAARALAAIGDRAESGRTLAVAAESYLLAGRRVQAVALGFELAERSATRYARGVSAARLARFANGPGLPLSLRLAVALWCRAAPGDARRAATLAQSLVLCARRVRVRPDPETDPFSKEIP